MGHHVPFEEKPLSRPQNIVSTAQSLKEPEPFRSFRRLFEEAQAQGIPDPEAMTLSTVDPQGRPWARVVLMKSFDPRGFVFYTNLESRKGIQIAACPDVFLNFFWRALHAQVCVAGVAEPVTEEEADAYFATRPRTSQLGAWASKQSRPLSGMSRLLTDVAKLEARYLGRPVPRPAHWSGFRVVPHYFEIWKGKAFRLHDRTIYERQADGEWSAAQRLYP